MNAVGAGTVAASSDAPALIDGGGWKVWPGGIPASTPSNTFCHDTCTDAGDCFHAMYIPSM